MALKLQTNKRTEGDGMENVPVKLERAADFTHSQIDSKVTHRLSLVSLKSPGMNERNKCSTTVQVVKQPKFVPYEPYKAAVRPIIPTKKKYTIPRAEEKIQKRHRTISSDSVTTKISHASNNEEEIEISMLAHSSEIELLNKEVKKLSCENSELEKELKMQVQINGELRKLLVASVGEDMETRVSCLTEDKLHLAQKLINTAKNLSTHHEQMEWLASQCEVWRSKFLASSVMVEELARWKAALAQKVNESVSIVKHLMDERKIVRKSLLATQSNLAFLRDNFDLTSKRSFLTTSNILDLSADSCQASNALVTRLLNKSPEQSQTNRIQDLPALTESETSADYMLKHPHPLNLIGEPDAACNAVVGAAVALHGELYHQNNPPRIACCSQCSGPIKLV